MKKKLLSGLLALTLLVGLLVPAEELLASDVTFKNSTGGSVETAYPATFGKDFKIDWEKDTDQCNPYYSKVTLPQNGILTIYVLKSYEKTSGYLHAQPIYVLDAKGRCVWGEDSTYHDIYRENYDKNRWLYYVGLPKGTYYIELHYSDHTTKTDIENYITTCRYTFQAGDAELEPNETESSATTLSRNRLYSGWFGTGQCSAGLMSLRMGGANTLGSDCENADYYKVSLQKGKQYLLKFGNVDFWRGKTLILCLINPNKVTERIYLKNDFCKPNAKGLASYAFTAPLSGTYYIKIYNYSSVQEPYQLGVYDGKTQKLTVSNVTKTLGAKAFNLKVTPADKNCLPLTYKSDRTDIATIDKNGKVTIKGIGVATITVTAGQTTDYIKTTKKVKITVLPKNTSIKSVKGGKKSLTVQWKKITSNQKSGNYDGYQIQYSTSKNFKNANSTKVSSKTTQKTIKKLKAKKKYYVRMRTYKKDKKTKKITYSGWTKAKTVTTKK